jgi:hypothetical protein
LNPKPGAIVGSNKAKKSVVRSYDGSRRVREIFAPSRDNEPGARPAPVKGNAGRQVVGASFGRVAVFEVIKMGLSDAFTLSLRRMMAALALVERDELDLILRKIGRRLDGLVSPGTPPALAAAQIVRAAAAEGWLNQLLSAAALSRSKDREIAVLVRDVRESQPAVAGDPYETLVLPSGRLFLGRQPFRTALRELSASSVSRILRVDGTPGSGKSHSCLLLNYLAQALGTFMAASFNLDPLATPDPGSVARGLLILLGGDPATLPDRETARSFRQWTGDLADRVEVEILRAGRPAWLVFDGLDNSALAVDVLDLIVHFALRAASGSGLLRVVMLGGLPLLPPSLESQTMREVIRPIVREDVAACANDFAARHHLEIRQADVQTAVGRIFAQVPPDGPGRNPAIEEMTRQLVDALREAAV